MLILRLYLITQRFLRFLIKNSERAGSLMNIRKYIKNCVMPNYKYVFVVLVYKNTEVLNGFFNSLKESVYDYKVVLVNSFYDELSKASCKDYADKYDCDFVDIPNRGYGSGNNAGIKFAMDRYTFDFLIISNSDIIVKKLDVIDQYIGKDCIIGPETIMLTGKKQNPCLGKYPLLASLYYILCRSGFKKNSCFLINLAHVCSRLNKICTRLNQFLTKRKDLPVLAIHGSFFIMTRNAVYKMFPVFSEEMFLYNEELYLGLRAKQKCVKVLYSTNISVFHLEGASCSGDFWKQYPLYRESFNVLNQYIEEGYFDGGDSYSFGEKSFSDLLKMFKT